MKIIIPGELPDLNKEINNTKKHWSYYSGKKRDWTDNIFWLIKEQKIKPITKLPVELHFTWICKNKKIDPDNICYAKKYVLDAMVLAGVLPNDGWQQISGFTDKFIINKDYPGCEIEY